MEKLLNSIQTWLSDSLAMVMNRIYNIYHVILSFQGWEIEDGVLIKYNGNNTHVVIPRGVTSIGKLAFRDCTDLTKVVIPNSVTSIGDEAFGWCWNLTEVAIPNSVTSIGAAAFLKCTRLTKVVIPESVTSIGYTAFSWCTSLTSIDIPNSVTIIDDGAFERCSNLTKVVIPNSVTSIGAESFSLCTGLTEVKIPEGVTSIEYSAFYGCRGLTSINIPNSVTSIEYSVFSWCTSLTSIDIPNSVAFIGQELFQNCTSLTSIDIPNSVTIIDDSAFRNCTSLTEVKVRGLMASNVRTWIDKNRLTDNLNVKNAVYRGVITNLLMNCGDAAGTLSQIKIGGKDMPIGVEYDQGVDFSVYENTPEAHGNPLSMYFIFSTAVEQDTVLLNDEAGYYFKKQKDRRYLLFQESFGSVPALYVDLIPDYCQNRFLLFANSDYPVVKNDEKAVVAAAGPQCQA